MADQDNKSDVGASILGNIIKILVNKGERVKEGQSLAVIEAMKMETNIVAAIEGIIEEVYVSEGQPVKTEELLMKILK
ncbi:biotin/lipoyl-containing protein [Clostridium paraputrificum]|uniref:biotin/lipoyl-containing protein n=1 Tax=Clostridium paraputrificum TaxID=29363 RepID=UPI00325C323D